jgi:hypothetical protein
MRNKNNKERRRYPRVEQRLPLNIAANGYQFATATENVSCVGTYCRVDKYIPPFTRVKVRLTLPIKEANLSNDYDVECKGVIVRSEDSENGGFNIAVFFNEINDTQRHRISRYVNQFLPK